MKNFHERLNLFRDAVYNFKVPFFIQKMWERNEISAGCLDAFLSSLSFSLSFHVSKQKHKPWIGTLLFP